jgi:hypothetical protein
MKLLTFLTILISFFIYSFFNLGNFLDVTVSPTKADLLVCLGGGDHKKRVEKTIELYKDGYLKSDTIIFTGVKEVKNIDNKFDKNINIIINSNLKNTMDEIKYIKNYMLKQNLSSAMIVTEAPHSRRIMLFSKIINNNKKELTINVIASEFKNWDSEFYYNNKQARQYAFSELIKIAYNSFVYGILEKVGLIDTYNKYFYEDIKENKEKVINLLTNL